MVASLAGKIDNSTPKDLREPFMHGVNDLLADGDMTALSNLVYNNELKVYNHAALA